MSHDVDVFLDLSGTDLRGPRLQRFVERSGSPERLGTAARRVTCVVAPGSFPDGPPPSHPGWSFTESSSVDQLTAATALAASGFVPLLILSGAVDVSCEAVAQLRRCLDRDPLFGFALPRTSCSMGCCLVRLSPHGSGATAWVTRRILADLPESEVIAEMAGPCLLVRSEVAANFDPLERGFDSVTATALHYMATARRCGFRTVLCNRAVVKIEDLTCAQPETPPLNKVSDRDAAALKDRVPDFDRSWDEFRAGSWERFECLYGAAVDSRTGAVTRSLVLDIRNLGPLFNGTSQAILNTVDGFRQIRSRWEIALLAGADGAAFHDLARRYAGWPLYASLPERAFTAALRLSQPWYIQEMIDLHRLSLYNAYLMLDTIAWDIVYVAHRHFDGTWQFLADHADALLFDSDFSRQRFLERFPAGRAVPNAVTHFSFDPGEYVRTDVPRREEPFVLVIGNDLDHKDVVRTVETLSAAFPFQPIVALGPTSVASTSVTALRSGRLPDLELHRLYACARFVVFPSFYEGFGFPIVTALGYGRTVLARRSALVEELAANCVGRGRLLLFDSREELVDLIGRLVHGDAVAEHSLGHGIANGTPRQWRNVAQDTLAFLEQVVDDPSSSRWIAREHAVRQLLAYQG